MLFKHTQPICLIIITDFLDNREKSIVCPPILVDAAVIRIFAWDFCLTDPTIMLHRFQRCCTVLQSDIERALGKVALYASLLSKDFSMLNDFA